MRNTIRLMVLGLVVLTFHTSYAQPIMDGNLDGSYKLVATSDGVDGWASASAGNLYVTHDATYVYFAAQLLSTASWQTWGFAINTTSGGGASEVWTYQIDYNHSDLPDYVIRGNFNPYVELRSWNGSSWDGSGGFAGTEYSSNPSNEYIEVRVTRASLGNPAFVQVQFYLTGNNQFEHGTFDAVPDDEVADSWNESSNRNKLSNYSTTYFLSTSATLTGSAGWRMMSNPVNGATFDDLLSGIWTQGFTGSDAPGVPSSQSNVRIYNTATKQFESISNQSNTMTAGTGFIVYVFSDDNYDDPGDAGFPKTLSLSGAENSGPVSPTLNTENKDPGVDNVKGWTLIGNPYATTIDSDLLARTNVENAAYVYNTASASYHSWNGSSGDLTDGLIAPFQGFFVQTSQTGTPSLTIPLSAKTTGGTFRGKTATVRNMRLLVKGEGLENSAWLQFSQGGSKSYDSFDTWKLLPLDPVYALLGTGLDNVQLDVNSLPYLDEVTEIPLHFSATKAGAFELSVTDFNVPAGYVITLLDNVTGNRVQLASDVKYSFNNTVAAKAVTSIEKNRPTGASASSSPRFTLIIDPGTTTAAERGVLPNTMSLDANYPNPFNPTTNIRFTLGSAANVKLAVYDATGREVEVITSGMKAAGAHTLTWNAAARASGVYLLRLEANGQTLTRKMTLLK